MLKFKGIKDINFEVNVQKEYLYSQTPVKKISSNTNTSGLKFIGGSIGLNRSNNPI
jgi:hypothetical protein